jgi:glucose-6-phosphate isomerase
MKCLKEVSGLDIALDGHELRFLNGLPEVEPACRTLDEARYAFCQEEGAGLNELYFMYRDVARPGDRQTAARLGLRYDITVILPGAVGREFNKTVGHYHPLKRGTSLTYPEVYEVLSGQATYLLQSPGDGPGDVGDVQVVIAEAGDKVVIPPGYGHITINAGAEPLVMANWVASEFASVYGEIRELKGGAHYLFADGSWGKNPLYRRVPEIRFEKCRDYEELGLKKGQGMYGLIASAPEKLRFLTHPEERDWGQA